MERARALYGYEDQVRASVDKAVGRGTYPTDPAVAMPPINPVSPSRASLLAKPVTRREIIDSLSGKVLSSDELAVINGKLDQIQKVIEDRASEALKGQRQVALPQPPCPSIRAATPAEARRAVAVQRFENQLSGRLSEAQRSAAVWDFLAQDNAMEQRRQVYDSLRAQGHSGAYIAGLALLNDLGRAFAPGGAFEQSMMVLGGLPGAVPVGPGRPNVPARAKAWGAPVELIPKSALEPAAPQGRPIVPQSGGNPFARGVPPNLRPVAPEAGARTFPHGFPNEAGFGAFSKQLNEALAKAGHGDTQAIFQGSSVTGKKFTTGEPFDVGRVSDFDIALANPKLLQRAKELGIELRSKGTRTGPLGPADLEKLGLKDLAEQLSKQSGGREVNFMIFDSVETATGRSPSILVPK